MMFFLSIVFGDDNGRRYHLKLRTANAEWHGNLESGSGKIMFASGRFNESYSAASRFEDGSGTNPEELIAAAHAGCYSMALSAALAKAGKQPSRVHTEATARLEPKGDGFVVSGIDLKTEAQVPDMDEEGFQAIAEDAKNNCPVSQALAGCTIRLDARLG